MIDVQQKNIRYGIHALEVHLPSSSEESVIFLGLTPFGAFLPAILDLIPAICHEKSEIGLKKLPCMDANL